MYSVLSNPCFPRGVTSRRTVCGSDVSGIRADSWSTNTIRVSSMCVEGTIVLPNSTENGCHGSVNYNNPETIETGWGILSWQECLRDKVCFMTAMRSILFSSCFRSEKSMPVVYGNRQLTSFQSDNRASSALTAVFLAVCHFFGSSSHSEFIKAMAMCW